MFDRRTDVDPPAPPAGNAFAGRRPALLSAALVATLSLACELAAQVPPPPPASPPASPPTTPDTAPPTASANAHAGLASLRRSADLQSDAPRVVERYRQFIQQNPGTDVAAAAAAELAIWEDRVARGLTRIAGAWLTPDEAVAARAAAADRARQAVLALRESRIADASDLLTTALAADPRNPTANYLMGVLAYRQDKLPDARKAFDAANTVNPGHGPTLNNLAVTVYRLNQQVLALNLYDQAMVVMPLDRGLMSNVAEALEAMPEPLKAGPVYKRLKRKFEEQDVLMTQKLAASGLSRWGSSWVTREQMADIRVAEAKLKEELDKLNAEFDAATTRIAQIEATIKANERDMRELELRAITYDQNGNIVQLPLPQSFYNMRNQNDQLKAEGTTLVRKQATLRTQARDLQKDSPVPKFSGIQQLYAAEAAPVLAAAASTISPANLSPTTKPLAR